MALRGCPLPPLPPRPPFFLPFSPAPPPRPVGVFPFFFPRPLVSAFPLPSALGALGLGALWLPAPPPTVSLSVFFFWRSRFFPVPAALNALGFCTAWLSFLFLLPVRPCVWCVRCVLGLSAPPLSGGCSSLDVSRFCCAVPWSLALFFGAVWCWCCAVWCVVVLCCLFSSLAVCRGRCFPLFSWCRPVPCGAVLIYAVVCRVGCRRALFCGVLCCVFWCAVLSGCQARCFGWGFSVPAPPAAAPFVPLPGPLSRPVVVFCAGMRCCAVLLCRLSSSVLLSASFHAGGALMLHSRWLVPCVVACGCWVFVVWFGCPPLLSADVLCRGCSCLGAWLAALLCAVVCCGAQLPCAVCCVLWCSVAVWCRAVVPSCPFCFAGGVSLCPFPVSAVLCCAVRRVVRCRFSLCCCLCLMLVCVAVCGAISLGVQWCGGAALLRGVVCLGVPLCRAVFCGAVLPCFAPLLGCAVCSLLLRVFLSPFSGVCWPWCPCLASGRPPYCLVCWCSVLGCPAPCAVSCGAVLPCGAVLSGCVVRLLELLVFVFPFVS